MWLRNGKGLFKPNENLTLQELEDLNAQLDKELDQHIDAAIHSSIILPKEVAALQEEKKALQKEVRVAREILAELKEEAKRYGEATFKNLLERKKRLQAEIQEIEDAKEVARASNYSTNILGASSVGFISDSPYTAQPFYR